jgi:hypothetical protein
MSGYIGTQPVPQATQTRDSFTATSGQTSFATSGYTPNYLDVYLNGVKLASADYTASNGSDVVLASGAATGDILEVVAYTTFTPADIPAGTPSIDDNGNATAMTITSDENVLIGTTDINPYDNTTGSGIALRSSGAIYNAINNGTPLNLNRMGSDGTIAQFRQGGTAVGSIGASGGDLIIGTGDTGVHFHDGVDSIIPWSVTAASYINNAIDLGTASYNYKDLYLSGGVYLGGTGSANKLDDYESGDVDISNLTFTNSGSAVANSLYDTLQYVKIGDQVSLTGNLYFDSVTSQNGNLKIPLPFANGGSNQKHRVVSLVGNFQNNSVTVLRIDPNQSFGELVFQNGWSNVSVSAFQTYVFNITYFTN